MSRTERIRKRRRKRRVNLALFSLFLLLTSILIIGILRLEPDEQAVETTTNPQERPELNPEGSADGGEQNDPQEGNPSPNTDSEADKIEQIEPENRGEAITISFAGDTMAAGKVAPILAEKGYMYPWEQVKEGLSESDLAMINLETAVGTGAYDPADKTFAFLSHPDLLKGASWAGVDLVTLANNHALDYGQQAFLDTLEHLREHNIDYVGGGKNSQEAYQRINKTVKGKEISFLGFSRVLPAVSWYAGENRPGLASGYQEEEVYKRIAEAAAETDLTIVYMHWGKELADEPEEKDRQMAYKMIDAGADVVIGSHPHVLQGLEYYKGKLIAYSLGNFIFTMSHHELGRQTAILQLRIEADGQQSARMIPLQIENGAVWPANDETGDSIMERMTRLSKGGHWTDHEFLPN